MQGPEKNSYKEFDNEKNSCGSKIPLPPITFLMVRTLSFLSSIVPGAPAQFSNIVLQFILCSYFPDLFSNFGFLGLASTLGPS